MTCAIVDELAAAYALGGVDAQEEREVSAHLETCDRPHAEARELIASAAALAAASEPIRPSPQLRDRLLATAAATPQDHRPVLERATAAQSSERAITWWRRALSPMTLAAVAVAVAIGLGFWNVNLGQQLAARDAALQAIAGADAVHQVTGSAGTGLLLDDGDSASFVAEDLAELPPGSLYELWLIGADGAPVAVGTLADAGGLALVTLEQGIGEATTFAVTVETERVAAPTSDPVLVASLEG